jgi:hypothetical protein
MTTRHRIHSTLPIRGVGFQYHTRGEEGHRQILGMHRFFAIQVGQLLKMNILCL